MARGRKRSLAHKPETSHTPPPAPDATPSPRAAPDQTVEAISPAEPTEVAQVDAVDAELPQVEQPITDGGYVAPQGLFPAPRPTATLRAMLGHATAAASGPVEAAAMHALQTMLYEMEPVLALARKHAPGGTHLADVLAELVEMI